MKIKDKKLKYKGPAFEVVEYTAEVDGILVKRDIIERKHGVVAVPIDKDKNVYMISEYCAGSNSFILSLPGGHASRKAKTKKDFAKEMQRELREETGYRAKKIYKLRFSYSHPSTSNRKSYVFLAYDLIYDPLQESGEIIDLVKIPLDEAIKKSYKDFYSDVSSIGNLLMARDKLKELGL